MRIRLAESAEFTVGTFLAASSVLYCLRPVFSFNNSLEVFQMSVSVSEFGKLPSGEAVLRYTIALVRRASEPDELRRHLADHVRTKPQG